MNRRIVYAAGIPVVLLFGALLLSRLTTHTPPSQALTPAALIYIHDTGCVLQPGDSMSVAVSPNTLIGFTYLTHPHYGQWYRASFTGFPPVRARYYLRFHGAKPWGLWVTRTQFTQPVLRINCRGGRLGNITQPPWTANPFPDSQFPLDP